MASGGDSKYIYRGKDVSPNLEVKVNVVDDAGNVDDTYSNAAKTVEDASKLDPKIAELHKKLDSLADEHLLPQFREIDPNLEAVYTGSFKTGTVGNPNKPTYGQPINLDNYDIDYWIKSDKLYEMYGNSLKANPEFRNILGETPGFEGLKPNKQGFSIKFLPSGN